MPYATDSLFEQNSNLNISFLILIVAIIILTAIASFTLIYHLTHNSSGSIYYTLGALLDVNSEGYASKIIAAISPNTYGFYMFVSMIAFDGVVKAVVVGLAIAWAIKVIGHISIRSKLSGISIRHMHGHIILCGYSDLGELIVKSLGAQRRKFVVIDKDAAKVDELLEVGMHAVQGDFTDIKTLERAGLEKAHAIIFCAEDDFSNLLGLISTKRISPNAKIISRARSNLSFAKMKRAGASLCVIPEISASHELAREILWRQ